MGEVFVQGFNKVITISKEKTGTLSDEAKAMTTIG